eukprot:scaffold244126_cov30-Tisochrysis_lutea.AAC.2
MKVVAKLLRMSQVERCAESMHSGSGAARRDRRAAASSRTISDSVRHNQARRLSASEMCMSGMG